MSLRETTAACKIRFTWWGTRKELSKEQKSRAAEAFDASEKYLSMGKLLIDKKHPSYKALVEVKGEARAYWLSNTLPYVEDGVRLIQRTKITEFVAAFEAFRESLTNAANNFQDHYREIKNEAARRLGELFNELDYPATVAEQFSVAWEFPSCEPPSYLEQLNPDLYERERARVQARFDEAARMAEQCFAQEMAELVSHLTERLAQSDDGKKKVFRDSAVTNLREFFTRFRNLSSAISNDARNEELDRLVDEASSVMVGVTPERLRKDRDVREDVQSAFAQIQERLGGMIVNQPRRSWQRTAATEPTPV